MGRRLAGRCALSPKSASLLVDWLAARNVRGPSDERAAAAEQQRAGERKLAQATTGMSPVLAKAFRAGPQPFKTALEREIPDKSGQIVAWLRVLGTSNDSWSELDGIDHAADEALKQYDAATLAPAVSAALLGQDRQLRRGAARLWMSWQSPLKDWQPSNAAELHSIVLQVQQDAHYYPLRMEALKHLNAWQAELPAEEIDRRLSAGLHDPAPQVLPPGHADCRPNAAQGLPPRTNRSDRRKNRCLLNPWQMFQSGKRPMCRQALGMSPKAARTQKSPRSRSAG